MEKVTVEELGGVREGSLGAKWRKIVGGGSYGLPWI